MVSSTSPLDTSAMHTGVPQAVLACLAIASTFVGLLYIWRGTLPRDHPTTVKRRLLSIAMVCSVAWVPAYFWATQLHKTPTPVHKLLGLRLEGLPRAVLDSLFLVTTLFAGPLVYFVYSIELPEARAPPPQPPPPHRRHPPQRTPLENANAAAVGAVADSGHDDGNAATAAAASTGALRRRMAAGEGVSSSGDAAAAGGGGDGGAIDPVHGADDSDAGDSGEADAPGAASGSASAPGLLARLCASCDLLLIRNLVVAPLAEEFVFRACMVPLLMLEGVRSRVVVLATPLFFGAAHLHHVADLVRHQGFSVRRAALMVGFQMLYTTVFGWLATYLFLRTGHLAAPVAAHAFCNWAGFPPFGDMAAHPRGPLLLATTAAGLVAFFVSLPRMTAPERYQQDFYATG
ncbi:hypothetical protein PLESTB_001506400 [Pleodorina starrii]|uniref:intramembrane prenyl-peptidase Rce1 n=1 Tax=Pleodorina starrii TaxID=330485 RepID=A0A9W6BY22_9CHLO|nr:hypothetical protein PLESTM_000659400 [Pleodorina starrii]GLC59616.1 hypothetical protein PLESTB_001506400 [Pleodorina starrii]GLC67853.1 hypothetical protein PLESTF_000614400 [Pleodorina starrii]